jgi:hypothetical protein
MNALHKREVHNWVTSAIINVTSPQSNAATDGVIVVIDVTPENCRR